MRLSLIVPVVFIFLISGCVSKTVKSDWKKFNLQSEVRSFEENYFYAVVQSGKIVKGAKDQDHYLKIFDFNKNGFLTQEITYTPQGELFNKSINHYDSKNQLVEVVYYGVAMEKAGRDSSFYDHTGRLKKRMSYNAKGGLNSKEIFFYNEKNQLIEYKLFSFQNNLLARLTYEYDAAGYRIAVYEFEPDGNLNRLRKYNFNSNGNEIEVNWYKPNMALLNRWMQQWNSRGNLVQKDSYNAAGQLFITRTFKYQYDRHGNWIKQIKFENGKPVQIAERKIIYF